MNNIESRWQFAPEFDEERKRKLISVSSFSEVIKRIVQEVKIPDIVFQVKPGEKEIPKNCFRPEFTLEVKPETFDLFFNSPYGYRAQYLHDPWEGQKQNGKLIDALSHKLMECAKAENTEQKMTNDRVEKSLRCCSTKIWICEAGLYNDDELIVNILVDEWVRHAGNANEARIDKGHLAPLERRAIWGVRAPGGTVLEVKGAFLDNDENEIVAPSKINRRFEIHEYGFS